MSNFFICYIRYSCFLFIVSFITFVHRVVISFVDIWKNYSQIYYNPGNEIDTILSWWEQYRSAIVVGVASDIIFALTVSLIALFLKPRFTFPILIVLSLFYAANIEHVLYNFSHIKIEMIHYVLDPTFVSGSGMTTSFFVSFGLMAVLAMIAAILTYLKWIRFALLPVAFMMLGATLMLPHDIDPLNPSWMQTHPLGLHVRDSSFPLGNQQFSESAFEPPARPKELQSEPRQNVLVVYLEGVSQHSISQGDMPFLKRLAAENVAFTRYFGNQTQTSNGLYTTLTGHLPNFLRKGSPWNTLSVEEPASRYALPKMLAQSGYNTAFLQSAALEFMNKDKHLAQLGFDDIKGRSDWEHFYTVNGWGIDDLSLFENGLNYIDSLDADTPWFVSFLTSGTHAPYNVPREFKPQESSRLRALKYADFAVQELMSGLQNRGLLENTVVIVTADESREPGGKSNLENEILLNWLPLIVVHPNAERGLISSPFGSTRFRNIVLAVSGEWSIQDIRSLEQPKIPLVFGNYYNSRVFWFDQAQESFFACFTQQFLCAQFDGVEDVVQLGERTPTALVRALHMQAIFEKYEPNE